MEAEYTIYGLLKWIYKAIVKAEGVWFFVSLFSMYVITIIGLCLSNKKIGVKIIIPYIIILLISIDIFALYNTKYFYPCFLISFFWASKNVLEEIKKTISGLKISLLGMIWIILFVLYEKVVFLIVITLV